ncbi:imidazole glycerol phosphate synthase subunit HisF [Desulfofustis glycolicus]|uniref:Imidazole glycerol phosphate synthase subunit HisH n=1 Tax=Desulfofustis glycolicus DSM 9705 TaxID=1121409 RepID=A0A1M5UBE3_9BACT|nr:imidazole glycerol phosphate synthase subunit HisF [Desulfofustis glycolicus]MCB2214543.1 imidazole glycerol phosphate synthase subunit HisF [Desulfobulbaceae bacterium]SHH60260.1 glutamine amidotransferase / cyclase [Desulfofustis glycolicus DSM 9705]
MITLLDYGAGNVRSVRNAVRRLGCEIQDVTEPKDILRAEKLIFPGVGSFGSVMNKLVEKGYVEPLKQRIAADKPFLGICVALQAMFEASAESPGVPGLGVLPGTVQRFTDPRLTVPQIGWNGIRLHRQCSLFEDYRGEKLYFVHSYHARIEDVDQHWLLSTTDYGQSFVSGICRGNVAAFQFHPEKSGAPGLTILGRFLENESITVRPGSTTVAGDKTHLAKRVIACLDVRSNDRGDLVVTKGDQYDVRADGEVRNLGKPVELAQRYFEEGADEITFLNITGFRDFPLADQPMLEVLRRTSEKVFVPLTIGGGIRAFTDSDGVFHTALDVASEYFRSGADKISIGSDAVYTVEAFLASGQATGKSAIEQISAVYGAQAVVISVDPRRIYVSEPERTTHQVIATAQPGPGGERYCWYQCTVKGGREGRDIDVIQLVTVCERLGAGEILLNCIDRDGTNSGFDIELINHVKERVSIPVIASSGAGRPEHFIEVFEQTGAEAALAAGIFHRREIGIRQVKEALIERDISCR